MARLIYAAIGSLDGYVADEGGGFSWAEPDEQVHRFVNDLERGVGVYLYGRRMYETMAAWETDPTLATQSEPMRDYAQLWQAAEKVVFSRTLESVATARTRLEREFDPEAIRRLKESAPTDLAIGGPALAAHAFKAGLIDECHLFVAPVIVGGGKRALPDGVHLALELVDARRFDAGTVHLHYRARA